MPVQVVVVPDQFADGLLTVGEFAEFIAVSRSEAYRVMQREVGWFLVNGRRKVPKKSAVAYLERRAVWRG